MSIDKSTLTSDGPVIAADDPKVSYHDLLPASYRTPDDDVQSPTATTAFLRKELGVDRLNEIHHWLWLVGRPMPPRPLHHQKAIGRDIVVHHQMDLHLVWDDQRIFLKPIPRYLFDQDFWRDNLTCKDNCLRISPYCGRERTDVERLCERCMMRQLTTGYLLTYASLIAYEHDFYIAKACNLVHTEISWTKWRETVKDWLTPENKVDINPRYQYGELRLGRLNHIYRFTLRSPIRGYLYGHRTYHHFWNANLARIATAFAYIIVVLTAMQVGLATDRLGKNDFFQKATYGLTVFSILTKV